MNLIERFRRRPITIKKYADIDTKKELTGKKMSKIILDGPLKMLMEKIELFNNDWIRERYLYNNRSMLEPLEDIGLTPTLQWKRGTNKIIEKLFVERILQYHKGGSLGLKYVRRPEKMQRSMRRAMNDVREIDTTVVELKKSNTTNLTNPLERKKMEEFIDICSNWFLGNITESANFYRNIKSMELHPYIVKMDNGRRISDQDPFGRSRASENISRMTECRDHYSNMHKELIVAVHIKNPEIRYHNERDQFLGNVPCEPVTILFRYHLASVMQRWTNLYYSSWNKMQNNSECTKEELSTWLIDKLNTSSHGYQVKLIQGERSVLWQGGDQSDQGVDTDSRQEGSYNNMSGYDVSGIYHAHNNKTLFPFINANSRSYSSGWAHLTSKGFMERLFKDINQLHGNSFRTLQDQEVRRVQPDMRHDNYSYNRQWLAKYSLPKSVCFGNIGHEINQAAIKGNFIAIVPFLKKWCDFYKDNTNPLNTLSHLVTSTHKDWPAEMSSLQGNIDWGTTQLLLKNGFGDEGLIGNNVCYEEVSNLIQKSTLKIGEKHSIPRLLNLQDRQEKLMFAVPTCIKQSQAKKMLTYWCDNKADFDANRFYRSQHRDTDMINNPDLVEGVATIYDKGMLSRIYLEMTQEIIDDEYRVDKYHKWHSDIEECSRRQQALDEEVVLKETGVRATAVAVRRIATPETRPFFGRYDNPRSKLLQAYNAMISTYSIIEESTNKENNSFYIKDWKQKYETFEHFVYDYIVTIFDKVIYNNTEWSIEDLRSQTEEEKEQTHLLAQESNEQEYLDEEEHAYRENEENFSRTISNIVYETSDTEPIEDYRDIIVNTPTSNYNFNTEEGRLRWTAHIRNLGGNNNE